MPRTRSETSDFSRFVDWARFYDIPMPAEGEAVAQYLLELMADGAALSEIRRVAVSISTSYKRRRCFLDALPVEAALAMCEAQLSPDRVLN
jgi:hypothetical protein